MAGRLSGPLVELLSGQRAKRAFKLPMIWRQSASPASATSLVDSFASASLMIAKVAAFADGSAPRRRPDRLVRGRS